MADYPSTNILHPGGNDILCGRGGGTNAHPGNIKFRKLVAAHKLRYLAAPKSDKPNVAREVVREWRAMDPPGRFLSKMDGKHLPPSNGVDRPVLWHDVGDKKAREKASQCLRERNGAANEAVAALVKTVTASGEACPEDYGTLMSKAALVKAKNELTIQQQNEMIKMGQHQQSVQEQAGGSGVAGGGSSNDYCQEAYEPALLQERLQQQQQQHEHQGYEYGQGGGNNYQESQTEDELIEAEIQRLLQQRQQQLQGHPINTRGVPIGGGLGSTLSNGAGGIGGGGGPHGGPTSSSGGPQPYMGEESVMREYEQLIQKQRELNMMGGMMGGMMGNNNGMNNGMMSGMNNSMGGMPNNNVNGLGMDNMSAMGMMAAQNTMSSNMGMNNGGMGSNGYGGQMQSNHNPDAAKDYMNRLRMLRQGGTKMPESTASSHRNEYTGNGGNMGNIRGSDMMNNMGNMQQTQGIRGSGVRGPEEYTIEEYQASLQHFLSHNDDYGGSTRKNDISRPDPMMSRDRTERANNLTAPSPYDNRISDTIECIQVATNLGDGSNKRNRRSSLRSVDDMDLPIGRNTFKSVDSNDRPSFQSMDDMDIRGTFRSVDTLDMMSIGNSINEIMEDDIKKNPEVLKKYGRRMSASEGLVVGSRRTTTRFVRNARTGTTGCIFATA